jgi:hypothetical protein
MFWKQIAIGVLTAWTAACTAAYSVRTVGKGNAGAEMSLGGPIFTNLGGPVPAPNLFVGGRYGLRDDLDISMNYNLTSPIVPGIGLNGILAAHFVPVQPGIGAQKDSKQKGWSAATSTSVHLITDFVHGAVVIPASDFAFGWRCKYFNPYLGLSLALHFFRPYDTVKPVFLSPFVGSDFILNKKVSLALRVTFYDVTYNMYGSQVEWVHLVNKVSEKKKYGIVGISLGVSLDFIRAPRKKPRTLETGGSI